MGQLEPGESTELVIHYKTYKYPGTFNKYVTVFTGAEGTEETVIQMVGNVEPIPMGVIRMEPRKTDVGELAVDRENEVQIVLENDGDAALTVSRIVSQKSDTEYYTARETAGIAIDPGRNAVIKLRVKPEEPGRFLERIVIYSDARNDIGNGYAGLLSGTAK